MKKLSVYYVLSAFLFCVSCSFIDEEYERHGAIYGIVTDRISGDPISGVNVTLLLSGASVKNTTTDSNGYYRFYELDPGQYSINVSRPVGYRTDRKNDITVKVGEETPVNFPLERD